MPKRTIGLVLGMMLGGGGHAFAAPKEPGGPFIDTSAGIGHFDRDDVLTAIIVADGLTGAWTAFELISGRSSGLFNGLTIVATAPAITFGAAVLQQNADDPALWTATLIAGAIFTVATIDILERHLAPDDPHHATARSLFLVPRIEPLENQGATRYGLALAGTF